MNRIYQGRVSRAMAGGRTATVDGGRGFLTTDGTGWARIKGAEIFATKGHKRLQKKAGRFNREICERREQKQPGERFALVPDTVNFEIKEMV